VQKGEIDVGFKLNEFTKFVIRINAENEQALIGAYNIIFNRKT